MFKKFSKSYLLSDVAGLALLTSVVFGFAFSLSESESDESDESDDDEVDEDDEHSLTEAFIHCNNIPFEDFILHLQNVSQYNNDIIN